MLKIDGQMFPGSFTMALLGLFASLSFCCIVVPPCTAAAFSGKVQALLNNAEVYSRRGDHVMALMFYNQAVSLQPGNIDLHYRRAQVAGRAGYYLNAIRDLTFVIEEDRMDSNRRYPHAVRFRGDGYLALGDLQKAANDYNAFLLVAPEDGKVWYYLAETYALMQRSDLALTTIKRGLATKSHWSKKLEQLRVQIMAGERIVPHKSFSN